MNPTLRLVLLSCLTCAVGCSVPSLTELEKMDGPDFQYKCDTSKDCPSNYTCSDNHCEPMKGQDNTCKGTDTRACTPPAGQCAGMQACGSDGTFGACMGSTGKNMVAAQAVGAGSLQGAAVLDDTRLMLATVEKRDSATSKLEFYTLGADGASTHVGSYVNPDSATSGRSIVSVALLALSSARVTLVWVEAVGPLLYLNTATLSATGGISELVTKNIYGSTSGPLLYVMGLTLASSKQSLLVLVSTNSKASPDDDLSGVRQVMAFSVPGSGGSRTFSGPLTLASGASTHYGTYATAAGNGDDFLVAYEDASIRYSAALSAKSFSVSSRFTLPAEQQRLDTHSPFLLTTSGNATDHTVSFVSKEDSGSTIRFATCTSTTGATCEPGRSLLFKDGRTIVRARMSAKPNAPQPDAVLLVSQETPPNTRLFATALPNTDTTSAPLRTLVNGSTFDELGFSLPGRTDFSYLVYQQHATLADTTSVLDTHLMSFCPL